MTAVSLLREKPKWPATLGTALCLMPYPAGILMFEIAASILDIKMVFPK